MIELTHTQEDKLNELAIRYDSIAVSELRLGPAVLFKCYDEDPHAPDDYREPDEDHMILKRRVAIGPDGEDGCELCGSITQVTDAGVYGKTCEHCKDQMRPF